MGLEHFSFSIFLLSYDRLLFPVWLDASRQQPKPENIRAELAVVEAELHSTQ